MNTIETPATRPREHFEFTGSGADYFRIWIVNIALTIVTFGIYSAWAKVRRLQYFHRNTRVAGSSFDYHARPMSILKGRLIAFAVIAVYNAAGKFNPLLALMVAVPIVLALPWMLRQSLRFRLHYSSWRGLRFSFRGDLPGAYRVFLLWPVLTVISLGMLGPMWHQRLKRFQHDHSAFGATPFRFAASVGKFYAIYLRAGLIVLALAVMGAALFAVAGISGPLHGRRAAVLLLGFAIFAVVFAAFSVTIGPYLVSRIQNLVWNNTTLGPHCFHSSLKARKLAWIAASNLFLIVITLGLFMPFAAVRVARYRVSTMTLEPGAALDEFVAGEKSSVAAVGEELGEFLDIDISL
ncbi:MAG: YjgN family protein [Betaproteobacteria bacterium]